MSAVYLVKLNCGIRVYITNEKWKFYALLVSPRSFASCSTLFVLLHFELVKVLEA